ncbi:MAG TPA: PAS domain-containing protein [Steroidobacteraceae bacterium]|nr:PAS domain-containing protein [Steroidobacteraceae bacterium]
MKASGDGFWELALSDGSAWFSEWFHERLRWNEAAKRSFNDLRPIFAPETWEMLLRQLRDHLEQKVPFDATFPVRLAEGQTEWWHMRGSAQLNDVGHPVHVAGSVRDVTSAPRTG